MTHKKYYLDHSDIKYLYGGMIHFRIVALRSFGDIEKGDRGGYIHGEHNLSHDGLCWVGENAIVSDYAKISDNSLVIGKAFVREKAKIYENAIVGGNSIIDGFAKIYGYATILGNSKISQNAKLYGDVFVCGEVSIGGTENFFGGEIFNGRYWKTNITKNKKDG